MENKTKCECPLSGFCNRHNVDKSNHMHKLCQNHPGYFSLWEQCRGPGQDHSKCVADKESKVESIEPITVNPPTPIDTPKQMPSIATQAKNFAGSAFDYLKSGMQNVDATLQAKRMEICNTCPLFDKAQQRCTDCGCFLPVKTKWASSKCPKGKW